MKVTCPGCSAEFSVDDNRVPPQGIQVRCPKCFKSVQAGGASAFGSDLEQALGVDLSGPAAQEAPLPAPASVAPSLRAGMSAEDWPSMDELSAGDANMIGAYQAVADGPRDDVWAGAPAKSPAKEPKKPAAPLPRTSATPRREDISSPPPAFEEPVTGFDAPSASLDAPAPGFADAGPNLDVPPTFGDAPQAFEPPAQDWAPPAQDWAPPAQDWAPPGAGDASPEMMEDFRMPSPPASALEAPPSAGNPDEDGEQPEFPGEPTGPQSVSPDAPDSIFAIEEASGVFQRPKAPDPRSRPLSAAGKVPAASREPPADGLGELEFGSFKRETITRDRLGEQPNRSAPGAPTPPQGGGPTIDDIDFSTIMDESSSVRSAPEAEPGGQVFFVDSPSLADGGGEVAFEKPKSDDAFSMEDIGLDGLDGLKPAAGAAGEKKDDIFDLDMGAVAGGMQIPGTDALKTAHAAPGMAVQSARPVAADRPAGRRKKGVGGAVVVAVVVLVGGAVAAWQLGLLDELTGQKKEVPVGLLKEMRPKVGFDTRLLPSPADYTSRFETMTRDLQIKADMKADIEEEFLWELAWYRYLYPGTFAAATLGKDKLADLYETYKKTYAGEVFLPKLDAMELAAQEQWPQAVKRFDEYLVLKGKRMADLLEKKKLTPQVAREDNLLSAWFKIKTGKLDEARDLLKDLVAEKGGELAPAYLLAMADVAEAVALEKAQNADRAAALRSIAVDKLKGLAQSFPQSSDVKLMLAGLLARDGKFDEAVSLGMDCLEKAREAKDMTLQVVSYRSLASFLRQKQDTDALLKLLEEMKASILEKNTGIPEPEDLLLQLCGLYVEKDMTEKAIGTLELCKSCSTAPYYLLLATAYQKRKLYASADEKAQLGLKKYPNDIPLLMLLSDIARQTNQTNRAVAYLETVLKTRPDNSAAALSLAKLFLDIQDPTNARRVLLQAERFGTDTVEIQQLLVQINEALGDDAGAVTAMQRILDLKDDDNLRKKLASILIRQGNYEDALKHFEILQRKGLITPDLRQAYAKSLRATGKTQEAVDVLKELLKENPGDIDTARFLADIYLQKEDFFNARLYLEAARRANSKDAQVHYLIGTSCLKLQDDSCALESFQAAASLTPDSLEYRVQYANLLFRLSRKSEGATRTAQLSEARKNFDFIIKRYATDVTIPRDQQSADVYFNRGTILFETGHFDEALKDLGDAMARAQSRYDILLAYADTLFKMNRYDQALKYYQEMVDSKFEQAHAYFYMGRIELLKGQKEQAKEYLLSCIGRDPKSFPDAHRHLGDIFREKGLRKKAADHYRTYLELVGDSGPAAEDVKAALKKL